MDSLCNKDVSKEALGRMLRRANRKLVRLCAKLDDVQNKEIGSFVRTRRREKRRDSGRKRETEAPEAPEATEATEATEAVEQMKKQHEEEKKMRSTIGTHRRSDDRDRERDREWWRGEEEEEERTFDDRTFPRATALIRPPLK